jgi:hypothetical protein
MLHFFVLLLNTATASLTTSLSWTLKRYLKHARVVTLCFGILDFMLPVRTVSSYGRSTWGDVEVMVVVYMPMK